MKIDVFCCKNDASLRFNHRLFDHRFCLHDIKTFDQALNFRLPVILMSHHSSNHKLVHYIRRHNVIIPIYIVSESITPSIPIEAYAYPVNGVISNDDLNYDYLKRQLKQFPQQHVWDYVFNMDLFHGHTTQCASVS